MGKNRKIKIKQQHGLIKPFNFEMGLVEQRQRGKYKNKAAFTDCQ